MGYSRSMILSAIDIGLLKELKAAGAHGRTIRTFRIRVALDRLAKDGYVVAHPTGLEMVHYRITPVLPELNARLHRQRLNRGGVRWRALPHHLGQTLDNRLRQFPMSRWSSLHVRRTKRYFGTGK